MEHRKLRLRTKTTCSMSDGVDAISVVVLYIE